MRWFLPITISLPILVCGVGQADGPQDNLPDQVRPIPPPGIVVPASERAELEAGLAKLLEHITSLRRSQQPLVLELVPDVEIFYRAVHDALTYQEFFTPQEIQVGQDLLRLGIERADQLSAGKAPWTNLTGLVVRGYVSRIDQSVQPYGLVIPASYRGERVRLDIWLHGRGEKLTELAFLNQRMSQVGTISPRESIVLHPYGRYCNGFKFAGEVDVLEAMRAVQRHYRVDEDRVAIRGFSMGGAGCWQLAVHYPDLWFAATPGAGFAETPVFLRLFQQETVMPTPWEEILWRLYDCPGYAANVFNCPTIAYSGELDTQKQAADIMDRALQTEGIALTHLIGPQTKHSIHPEAALEIERRLATLAKHGRDHVPRRVQLATFTLKYNRVHWLTITGLEKHWEPARAEAEIAAEGLIRVAVKNITGFSLDFPAGWCPFDVRRSVTVEVNGQRFAAAAPLSDRSWSFHWWRGEMRPNAAPAQAGLLKRHDLQGPIDDAFMDTFLVVRPTGQARHKAVESWTRAEYDRLTREWRRQFRGHALVKDDTAITDADVQSANLILFGDPESNALIRRIIDKLPLQWNEASVSVGSQSFDATQHAPVLIYPNPLNPQRYVVLNSGFTYREYDYLNNARQVPRLPDWAMVDLRTPPNSRYPGKIAAAGFFNERWEVVTGNAATTTP